MPTKILSDAIFIPAKHCADPALETHLRSIGVYRCPVPSQIDESALAFFEVGEQRLDSFLKDVGSLMPGANGPLKIFICKGPFEIELEEQVSPLIFTPDELEEKLIRRLLTWAQDRKECRKVGDISELFRSLVEAAPDIIVIMDENQRLIHLNPAGRQLLGISTKQDISSFHLSDFRPPQGDNGFTEYVMTAAKASKVWNGELELYTADRQRVPTMAMVFGQKDSKGKLRHLSIMARDMRDQRRLETQLHQAQRMEVIGQFAGGIAHDFNNKMGIIGLSLRNAIALAPVDRDADRDQELLGHLDVALASVGQATELTKQLLATARQQVQKPEAVDLLKFLEMQRNLLAPILGSDVNYQIQPIGEVPPILVDPVHLDQVILNLAVNAKEAMEEGGEISFRLVRVQGSRPFEGAKEGISYVCMSVADSGPGMAPEVISRLFEPFFTTKEVGKGTGLGLPTVMGIMKQSGGHIHAESPDGKGATFHCYFPVAQELPKKEVCEFSTEHMRIKSKTVLLVEDEEHLRKLVSQLFEEQGHKVIQAKDGKEGLELYLQDKNRIDVVITDLTMPRMKGDLLIQNIRDVDENVPVIFMSGYLEPKTELDKAVHFLPKPVTPEALWDTFSKVWATKNLQGS